MTLYTPSFNPSDFELRGYTNPYLTEKQKSEVQQVEGRVEENLDFIAQMLGWSGNDYWGNLPDTVSEKRQLLGGTYGVYNGFIVPKVYEVRNWNDTVVVERLPLLSPNKSSYIEYVLLGEDRYTIQNVSEEGDRYVVYLGPLPDSFYTQIANGVPLLVSAPEYRPAPFYRPSVGTSGDCAFTCSSEGSQLVLYPLYDTGRQFRYRFPTLFAGSTYYFDQPVYLSASDSLTLDVAPEYNADSGLWYLSVPENLSTNQIGFTAYLVWAYAGGSTTTPASLGVSVQTWTDPSDWGSESVLRNYKGAWNNKGGALPFNLVFDSLGVHGVNERNSVYLPEVVRTLSFDDLVDRVYSQRTPVSEHPPGTPAEGDLWWNNNTGALSVWSPAKTGCTGWVEIDYRVPPEQFPLGDLVYTDVTAFRVAAPTIPLGTRVTILDVTGLTLTDNVLGVSGTLGSPGALTLFQPPGSSYWTPIKFLYSTISDFERDCVFLPQGVPLLLSDSTGLSPVGSSYRVLNLPVTLGFDYAVTLEKYYNNTSWVVSSDSIIPYVADSSLFVSPTQGEMWWDYAVPTPELRSATVYYQGVWVGVNSVTPSAAPSPTFNPSVLQFLCNGTLLTPGVPYLDDNFFLVYTQDSLAGTYTFTYTPRNLEGQTQFPTVTLTDNLTTTYQSDVSPLVFSGLSYYLSPNVYDAETPLRLWKTQDLQVVDTVAHLTEDNYINPLRADLNSGPGLENWERYFVRLPLDYGRNESKWQKVLLTCQDFGYWGSTVDPERMECPPEDDTPVVYEELFLYDTSVSDYTYVYCESYLYSNVAYLNNTEPGDYRNAGVYPSFELEFDQFDEAQLVEYDPLHNRQANLKLAVGKGYGNWEGEYVNVNPCVPLSGFFTTDLLHGGVVPVAPPVWDASIYKFAPTCENEVSTYTVDANHYKVGYCYFVADASAAEEGFFDVQQRAAWRSPSPQSQSLYLLPR